MKRVYLIVPVLFTCISCNTIATHISDLDRVIEQSPDSALRILNGIRKESLKSTRARAIYSLQKTKAMDKCYLTVDQDSLIHDALDYYSRRRNARRLSESWYYQGRIQYTNQDFNAAAVSFTKAARFADKFPHDPVLKGLISLNLAHTFGSVFNDNEELFYAKKSLTYFQETGDPRRTDAAAMIIAQAYHAMRQWDSSIRLYDSLEQIAPDDTLMMQRVLLTHAAACIYKDNPSPQRALSLFEKAIHEYHAPMDIPDYARYSYSLHCMGDKNTAQSIIHELEQIGSSPVIEDIKYRIAKESGDYAVALTSLENILAEQDSIVCESLRQSVLSGQRDYFELAMNKEDYTAEKRKLVIIIYVIISFLIFIIAFIVIKKWKSNIDRNNAYLVKVKDQSLILLAESERKRLNDLLEYNEATRTHKKLAALRHQYLSFYKHQFAEIGKLCEPLLLFKSRDSTRKIISQIKDILNSIVNNKNESKSLEALLNKHLGNVMYNIRKDFPNLKQLDYQIISYIIAGFDAKFIAIVTDTMPDYVYVRKYRYLNLICKSDSPNKEIYRELLGDKSITAY